MGKESSKQSQKQQWGYYEESKEKQFFTKFDAEDILELMEKRWKAKIVLKN